MKYSLLFSSFLLLFEACSFTRHWQGTSTPNRTQAVFEGLHGRQNFTLRVPDSDTYLSYHFAVSKGILQATIQSPTQNLLSKEIDKSESDSIHLVNQKGAVYKINLKGKQATGEFDIKFSTNAR